MDPEEKAQLEAANGLRQFDRAMDMVDFFLVPDCPFTLHVSHITMLRALAVEGIESEPEAFRRGPVGIQGSEHTPPGAHLIQSLVQEMCDYVADNWHEYPAFHLAAYVMWRMNWIHPFTDGNGRTARVLSYLVLCVRVGYKLPGSPTIPEQIQSDKSGYIRALEAADEAARNGRLDLSEMENLVKSLLAKQLLAVIEAAQGEPLQE